MYLYFLFNIENIFFHKRKKIPTITSRDLFPLRT